MVASPGLDAHMGTKLRNVSEGWSHDTLSHYHAFINESMDTVLLAVST